jgi:hypothetical protein
MYDFAKDALAGNYNFDIKALIDRSSAASRENMPALLSAIAICFVFMMIYAVGFINYASIDSTEKLEQLPQETLVIAQLILVCLTAPIFAGLTMIGVKTERKEKVSSRVMLRYFSSILVLATATLIISFLTQLGFAILILPGLYMMVASSFTQVLIVDKGLNPISALLLSIKVANKYLLQLVILYLIYAVLFFFVLITFGFAIIWVGPFYFNLKGILYNDLFSSQEKTEDVISHGEETYFDA